MKIYETEDDGKIGDLLYKTVEFDEPELIASGGVISQGAAQRYLAKERPDLKIKKCGSFKLNPQERTITMRIGVVNRGSVITTVSDEVSKVKLLNPGYDELQKNYDSLQAHYDQIVKLFDLQKKMYNELKQAKEELHAGYDRVVEGARKDDKEFHELKMKYNALIKATGLENHIEAEDAADLADAKEAIESADSVPLSGVDLEPDIGDKEIKDTIDATSKLPSIQLFDGSPEVKTHLAS